MVALLVRFVGFFAFGILGSASLIARLGPEFDVVFWFLAVISAFGMEVAWQFVVSPDPQVIPDRSVGLYVALLVVAGLFTATTVYAAPYAPYCEGWWKYVNYFACA